MQNNLIGNSRFNRHQNKHKNKHNVYLKITRVYIQELYKHKILVRENRSRNHMIIMIGVCLLAPLRGRLTAVARRVSGVAK